VALELLDGEAEYPLTIDPWLEQQKVTASDGAPGDTFGFSVAISGDTAIIGANEDTIGGNADQGSAYVFTRSGSTWTQQQKLTASDGAAGDFFGNSVAISVDTVIVGANLDTVGANATQGSAYVFTRSGSTWTEQQKLTASDGAAFDLFGSSVAIDGDTAIVGAFADTVGANGSQSSAYVFAFVTSTPTATATSTATSTPTSTQTQTAIPTATATATSASTSRHCWALLPASSPRAG